ncbi:MAG TPA: M1 family metallopeptidase [Bacteroidia bacterium]|nr:M1 family metallopeptidase [Bacteroidia bacterium]HNT79143.1 M1 family metallopeptidase [Bacteroidia bacterium]
MKIYKWLFTLLLVSNHISTNAQSLSFQQKSDHQIFVTLDDVKNELHCSQTVRYTNNSSDTLKELYFHIWPNAYSNRETALAQQMVLSNNLDLFFAKESEKGRMKNFSVLQNESKLTVVLDEYDIDICKIILQEPVAPASSIDLAMRFDVVIPSAKFSRLGRINQAYYITQWYPKPAVYDSLGWHQMPYLNQGEFFSEFGDYEVHITVPANYVVAATGELQNSAELDWLKSKSESYILNESNDLKFPPSDSITKTLIYKQSNIHDFAWFADKRFNVLHDTLQIPGEERIIDVYAYFTDKSAKHWVKATHYLKRSILFYSEKLGSYPYNVVSAVDGTISAGGGMEYPTITILSKVENDLDLETVIVHEVGHNWLYGILASNERDYPWMDEGINSYYEIRYLKTYLSDQDRQLNMNRLNRLLGIDNLDYSGLTSLLVNISERKRVNQKVSLKSTEYSSFNYGLMIYGRVPMLFNAIESQFGTALMDSCMRIYFNEWKFRHPYPGHLKQILETAGKKDVSWLFDDAFDMERGIEYKIYDVATYRGERNEKTQNATHSILVGSKGLVAAPFEITAYKGKNLKYSSAFDGIYGGEVVHVECPGCDKFVINERKIFPELYYNNNTKRLNGLFRGVEPLKIAFLPQVERADRTQLFILPLAAWNNTDKWMTGLSIYNIFLPEKKFEFAFTPLYSFRTEELNGFANFHLNLYPSSGSSRRIQLGVKGQKFSYQIREYQKDSLSTQRDFLSYQVFAPYLEVDLYNKDPRSETKKKVRYQYSNVSNDFEDYLIVKDGVPHISEKKEVYHNIDVAISNRRKLDPFSIGFGLEFHSEYFKTYFEAKYKITYNKLGKGISARWFGSIYDSDNDQYGNYFSLSGKQANSDYQYSNLYFDRSNADFWNRQFQENEGGFKTYVPTAVTEQKGFWMSALNIEIEFPGALPIVAFADIGTYNNADKVFEKDIFTDAGIALKLGSIFQVYFPFMVSQNLDDYYDLNDIEFSDRIRFQINLPLFGFEKLRDQLSYQVW